MNEKAATASEHQLPEELIDMTCVIVKAYVSNNAISPSGLPDLIAQVHASLAGVETGSSDEIAQKQKPAVPVKKSVTSGYIVCLEDGKKFKSLKRHLRTHHQATPEEYRAKWGLNPEYPMVAPAYSERRSSLAKKLGLGRKT
jgi:predicted transcriptional regulator